MRKILTIAAFCYICPYIHAQEFVDLGLSANWCTTNIGAASPYQSGDLFAWGETEPRKSFTMKEYIYKDPENNQWTIDIGKDISGTLYDAATQNTQEWRMPTLKEFLDLCEKCNWKWINKGKKKGYQITGPNGNHIFLPVGGLDSFGNSNKKTGNYWSGTLSQGLGRTAIALAFDNKRYHTEGTYKAYGKLIRPVKKNPIYVSQQKLPKEWTDLKYANLIQQIESEDYQNAFNTAETLAKKGDAQAQCVLATMYMCEVGTTRDYKIAQKLLIQAAKQGYRKGEYILGGFGSLRKSYELMKMLDGERKQLEKDGNNFWYQMLSTETKPETYKEAFKWFYLQEEQWGYRDIMYYAGLALIHGDYGYKNLAHGIQWIMRAARLGYKEADDLLKEIDYQDENEE